MKLKTSCLFIALLCSAGFLLLSSQATLQTNQLKPAVLVITHANVIDGISDQPLRDATVIVREGMIENVFTANPPEVPADATTLDLKGRWLLPGLIDAHVHISALSQARTALASGVTTVRCLGVDHFIDVGIREFNHQGMSDVPDVVEAGYPILAHPNSEARFLDLPKMSDLMGGLSGTQNIRRMVRAMLERDVNVIKIFATERAQTDPRKRMFTDEQLTAAVDEARKAGIPVAAHAHGDEGAGGSRTRRRASFRAGLVCYS